MENNGSTAASRLLAFQRGVLACVKMQASPGRLHLNVVAIVRKRYNGVGCA